MAIVFPVLLIALIVVVLAFRLAGGLWSNLVMLGNVIVAALVATNYFESLATLLVNTLSMLAYYADFLAVWILFAVTLMIFKAVTDIASRVKVRFPKLVETIGNFAALLATGWVLVCFTAMTVHVAPLGRDAFGGGFKPENANFFGFAPDRLWMGFVQRASEGTFATAHVFDDKGDFLVRYAARREKFDHVNGYSTPASVPSAAVAPAPSQPIAAKKAPRPEDPNDPRNLIIGKWKFVEGGGGQGEGYFTFGEDGTLAIDIVDLEMHVKWNYDFIDDSHIRESHRMGATGELKTRSTRIAITDSELIIFDPKEGDRKYKRVR